MLDVDIRRMHIRWAKCRRCGSPCRSPKRRIATTARIPTVRGHKTRRCNYRRVAPHGCFRSFRAFHADESQGAMLSDKQPSAGADATDATATVTAASDEGHSAFFAELLGASIAAAMDSGKVRACISDPWSPHCPVWRTQKPNAAGPEEAKATRVLLCGLLPHA